jgi:hypothetical protein
MGAGPGSGGRIPEKSIAVYKKPQAEILTSMTQSG